MKKNIYKKFIKMINGKSSLIKIINIFSLNNLIKKLEKNFLELLNEPKKELLKGSSVFATGLVLLVC